jgi:hypothetical protein
MQRRPPAADGAHMTRTKVLQQFTTLTPHSAGLAFEAAKAEIEAIPADQIMSINVDVPSACAIGLVAADRLEAIAPQMFELAGFERRALERLRVYALAALYANAVATQSDSNDTVATLLEEAVRLRESLLVAAEALAHRGLLSAERVAEIRSGQGHLDTANDCIALGALFAGAWDRVGEKTAITREEVDRAAVCGSQLHIALGAKRLGGAAKAVDSQATRERAFTLFVRAYDECRRAVAYLRWHEGDADEYAPSIYVRRKRRGVRAEEPSTDVPTPVEPATSEPTPPAPVEPAVVTTPPEVPTPTL